MSLIETVYQNFKKSVKNAKEDRELAKIVLSIPLLVLTSPITIPLIVYNIFTSEPDYDEIFRHGINPSIFLGKEKNKK